LDENVSKYIKSEEISMDDRKYSSFIEILEFQSLSNFLQKELIAYIFKLRNN